MALIAAAVCPHPPLLVPEVGRGIELPAREAARAAVRRLVSLEPELVVLVGADFEQTAYDAGAAGSFARYGVDLTLPLRTGTSPRQSTMPLSLTVGAWLLAGTGWAGDCRAVGVPDSLSQADSLALGAGIAARADRVALLCMGDGSARRTEKAPGWLDERAEPFDRAVAEALEAGDAEQLQALDHALARDLLAAGWTSWQVLAGAAQGRDWTSELLANEAPFGVGYFVAFWGPADAAGPDAASLSASGTTTAA